MLHNCSAQVAMLLCIKSVTQVTQCGSVTVCQCYCAELLCGGVTVQSVTVEAANVTPPAQHNLKW